jgi:hypothetical protein
LGQRQKGSIEMKNNPYNRPGYVHAVGDAKRDYYSVWALDHKKKVNEPKVDKTEKNAAKVEKAAVKAVATPEAPRSAKKKTSPVAKVFLVILLLLCIAVILGLNFFTTQEMNNMILNTLRSLIGMYF